LGKNQNFVSPKTLNILRLYLNI